MKETANINYTQKGMYLYPNLKVRGADEQKSLGKYGLMRSRYLQEHNPMLADEMFMNGTLMNHLYQVDKEATERVEQTVERMAQRSKLPDRKTQPIQWAQEMAMLKAQAEEAVVKELIYEESGF